ncbi:chitobiase/beta-hexosaminidase C-terminal domain-containing protein [Leptospira kanakyensis]|uniref:chitobiase/beta-hexosaminidase C-terminal domain-containing protein n=1 Tax=Leptospira kanakyensis TaxID=2484968 RepID=UPI00223DD380|nr:chitobiase/beta-hexosaminidase C-terminal domain-containing protein [Leptospira kanakyensis]MCW7481585.1 chitobiase/beta-hexosaminidase C-terminal domain-containing protein [Leptospira kanakyensis]
MRNRMKLSFISILFLTNCVVFPTDNQSQADSGVFAFLLNLIGGSPTSSQNLSPGTAIDLSGDGTPDGTLIDTDGDGVSDSINLTGGNIPNLVLLDTNGDGIPDAVDTNGDGIPDYYINPNPPGFLTTGPGGSGNPVVIVLDTNGNPLGFDTDGDGTANDTTIVTILSDTTPPTITSSLLAGTYSTTQTTTLTCSDNKAPGSIVYTLDGSTPSFYPKNGMVLTTSSKSISLSTEGTHTLQTFCRDLAGNVSSTLNIVYTIDTKIPALTIISQSSQAISSSSGAIGSSTATWRSDRSGPYTVREGSSCESGTIITTGSITANVDQGFVRSHTHFTGEGIKTYRICVTGSNGLTGFVSVALTRDDTAPVVTADPGTGSYGVATSVSLSCSDTGGTGCEQIVYTVQIGTSPSNPNIQGNTGNVISGSLYTSAISMSDGAVTYTKFIARDKAGNVSNVNSQNYTVDTQVATITVNSHTQAINGTSNVTLSWQSSKVGSYQFRMGGSNCSNGTALTNTGSNTNVTGNAAISTDITTTIANSHFVEGNNTIRICVTNLVGSFGSTTRSTHKDTVAPLVSMVSPSGVGPFPSGTQLQLSCSDTGGLGCDQIIYTLNGTEPTFDGSGAVTNGMVYSSAVALSNGNQQVKYLGRDLAGNLSSAGNQSFYIGPPDAPSFVEAQAGGGSAVVQWWPVSGATSYTVYYSTSPGVTTSSTSFGPVTDPIATITGLSNGSFYYFRVVASSAAGSSVVSLFEAGTMVFAAVPGTNTNGSHFDISAGQGTNAVPYQASAVIDTVNQKLLAVSQNGTNSNKLSLYRCDLDGSNCAHIDISAGQGSNSGTSARIVIDRIHSKLLVAALNNGRLSLYRCHMDGTSCTHSDISAGQTGVQSSPFPVLDYTNKKLLVVTNYVGKSALFRCDLDGTNCTYTNISAGQPTNSGQSPSVAIDPIHSKLLFVTNNWSVGGAGGSGKPGFFRCNLDGSSCVFIDISAGQGGSSGTYPSIVVDTMNRKFVVTTCNGSNNSKLGMFRCDLDGTNCSHTDISAGQGLNSGNASSAIIDTVNAKLITVTANGANNGKPGLFRCNLDGSSCTHTDISSAQGTNSGNMPVTLLNPFNGKILVVTQNAANNNKPSLYLW